MNKKYGAITQHSDIKPSPEVWSQTSLVSLESLTPEVNTCHAAHAFAGLTLQSVQAQPDHTWPEDLPEPRLLPGR